MKEETKTAYKASIPLRVCRLAWLLFVVGAVASYVVGDWLVLCMMGWFAFWETYGILTPRPLDTMSETWWDFTRGKPARFGLTLGMVVFFFFTLIRLAWEVVYGEGAVADALKFLGAAGLVTAATTWLTIHFIRFGRLG